MAGNPLPLALRHIYKQTSRHPSNGISDAQLLERFVQTRDESAFELLLYRHGAMVWGVCYRVLQDHHDAEDAFQAAWLTLARKATSIGRWDAVSSWMFKVAYRVAQRLRTGNRRRIDQERHLPPPPDFRAAPEVDFALLWRELQLVLDQEVKRLPEKLRRVVVLCYLEGKTNDEAAQLLAWPVGTVKTRLARARELLCSRLTQRGLATTSAMLAATVTSQAATVALPLGLVGPTVQGALLFSARKVLAGGLVSTRAVLLTKGVLQAMMTTKIKLAAALLIVGVACGSVGFATYPSSASKQSGADPVSAQHDKTTPRFKQSLSVGVNADAGLAGSIALNERNFDTNIHTGNADKKSPVAVIYGDTEITREELGEYLIRRASAEHIQGFVNLRILEHAANQKGIKVSSEEVDAALEKTLKELDVTLDEFRANVLAQTNKTLLEWREDVLRPRLLAEKLCKDRVRVTEEDVQRAFETAFGERVKCQAVIWPKAKEKTATEPWLNLRKNPELFDCLARKQWNAAEATGSAYFEYRRHEASDPANEKVIFSLKEGEISTAINTPTQVYVLKCLQRIPADATKKLEDIRDALEKEVRAKKIEQETPVLMKELKEKARAKVLMEP